MECNILLLWTGLGILTWAIVLVVGWFRNEEIVVGYEFVAALISIVCGPFFLLIPIFYVAYLIFLNVAELDIWSKKIQRKKK